MNGLCINEDEFMSMSAKKQMCVLFQNQVKTMELIRGYKIYYRITTIIGSVLVLGMGFLFKLHLGGV